MAVADVPGCGLALRGREGERATLSERLTVGGRPCHHGVVLLSVGCHDGGEVRCFVHAVILQGQGRTICSTVDSASAVTVRAGVEVQKRTPTAARMISRNMVRW